LTVTRFAHLDECKRRGKKGKRRVRKKKRGKKRKNGPSHILIWLFPELGGEEERDV